MALSWFCSGDATPFAESEVAGLSVDLAYRN
jgi:hypothetical protein